MPVLNPRGSLSAAMLAAIGASLCCVAPLALLAMGIGGAWIANLTALEPYRPIFVGLTLLFLGLAFRSLYLTPKACPADKACPEREAMPIDYCEIYYQCGHCRDVLRPKAGDCCVFCSYGSVPCPPQRSCCATTRRTIAD